MALKADLESKIANILSVTWDVRDGQSVPSTNNVNLSNGAVRLEAAYLYADLADSTTLGRDFNRQTAARVVRSYLHVMSTLIREHGGEIRSFDGDRVMGIFIGDSKRSDAAKCALKMNWALTNIVRPRVYAAAPILQQNGYTLEHTAGIDVGNVLLVRAGVRGNNDLISVGAAPNIAARLSEIRESGYRSYITKAVYDRLSDPSKFSNGTNMWQPRSLSIKGKPYSLYRSSYHWSIT
jgi:adenylate cyclase